MSRCDMMDSASFSLIGKVCATHDLHTLVLHHRRARLDRVAVAFIEDEIGDYEEKDLRAGFLEPKLKYAKLCLESKADDAAFKACVRGSLWQGRVSRWISMKSHTHDV